MSPFHLQPVTDLDSSSSFLPAFVPLAVRLFPLSSGFSEPLVSLLVSAAGRRSALDQRSRLWTLEDELVGRQSA